METPVSIIIVTHDNWEYTKLFLDSLRKYSNYPYEVICVDNASTDRTATEIKKYAEVKFLPQKSNLGYGKAVNLGFKEVKTEYFALINNDIIVSPDWLKDWVEIFSAHPEYWQMTTNSNSIIDIKGQIENISHQSWQEFKKKNEKWSPETLFKKYYGDYEKFCEINKAKFGIQIEEIKSPKGFLGGWALIMRTDLIGKIGGYLYDESFEYGFYEDVDLSWRIGLAGGKTGIARGIYLHHFINTTFDAMNLQKHEISKHNKWRFIDKWEDFIVKTYLKDSEGDLDKLYEGAIAEEGRRTIIDYLGVKKVMGIKSYEEWLKEKGNNDKIKN